MNTFNKILIYAVVKTFVENYMEVVDLIVYLAKDKNLKGSEKREIVIEFIVENGKNIAKLVAELAASALLVYAQNNGLIEYDDNKNIIATYKDNN